MADDKEAGRRASLGVVRDGEKKASKNESGGNTASDGSTEAAKAAVVEQIAVLKEDVARLKESLGALAESGGHYAVSQASTLREEVRATVVANPLSALFGAAFLGYLLGLRRR